MEKLQSILNYSVGSFTVGKIFEAVIVFVICYFLIRIIMILDYLFLRKL